MRTLLRHRVDISDSLILIALAVSHLWLGRSHGQFESIRASESGELTFGCFSSHIDLDLAVTADANTAAEGTGYRRETSDAE